MKSFFSNERSPPGRDLRAPHGASGAQLGDNLKAMFQGMAAEPMPDRLVQLAQALEEAFERGELYPPRGKLDA